MRVLFLGTGSAEGLPAIFCDCDVCAEARRRGGRDIRTRSTVLIDERLKIDLPPDTLCHVHRGAPLHSLEHLLFTHSHDDHFAVRELQYLSPNFAPQRRAALHVWASADLIGRIGPETAGFFEDAPLVCRELVPFRETDVGAYRVTPIVARHKENELCFNYLVSDGERTLLYASDTGWYDPPTWEFLEGVKIDAAIVECGKGIADSAYPGHLSVEEVCRFRERLVQSGGLTAAAPFWVTHIAHTGLLLHDSLTERLAPHGIAVAWDGLTVML